MAQVVSRWPLAAEAWVRARVNPCGIFGGQSSTGTGFSLSVYQSTVALQTHIIWGMRNMLALRRHPRLGLTHPTFRKKSLKERPAWTDSPRTPLWRVLLLTFSAFIS
jgi:hypothetical protein